MSDFDEIYQAAYDEGYAQGYRDASANYEDLAWWDSIDRDLEEQYRLAEDICREDKEILAELNDQPNKEEEE